MADVHSTEVRSYNMSRIKSKNTKPEMLVRRFLHTSGFRFRLHVSDLPGKPDIVLPKYKTVILVNGCFFHAHQGCKDFRMPKTRTEWWRDKIEKNLANDIKNVEALKKMNWHVITIWGCELKKDKIENTLNSLLTQLQEIMRTNKKLK